MAVRVLALAAVVGALWYGWLWWGERRVTITFVTAPDQPLPSVELTFLPDQLAFAAPSPPPPLGQLRLAAAAAVTVGSDLVPGSAAVRFSAPGCGTGFRYLRLGEPAPPIRLAAGRTLAGTVGAPIGFWSFGWRCAGMAPVAGAEVTALGGDEHGVVLAQTTADAEGRFTLADLDATLEAVTLRVRARGFALQHQRAALAAGAPPAVVTMAHTEVVRGVVVLPAGVDATTLKVLARGLPGVQATPAADGTFELADVPLGVEPRLLVHGLPAPWTHATTRAARPDPVRIEVVAGVSLRGRVVDALTQHPLAEALVYCGDDVTVRADRQGRFELPRLVPGTIEIGAQIEVRAGRKRSTVRTGRHRLEASAGQSLEGVLVPID